MSIIIRRIKDYEIITCEKVKRRRNSSMGIEEITKEKGKRDVMEVINRRKEYSKIQYKLLNIPDEKRKTSVIGNMPLDFLKPNKDERKQPFIRRSTFQMMNQMKGIVA